MFKGAGNFFGRVVLNIITTLVSAFIILAIIVSIFAESGKELISPNDELPKKALLYIDFSNPIIDSEPDDPLDSLNLHNGQTLRSLIKCIKKAKTDDRIVAIAAKLDDTSLAPSQIQEIHTALQDFNKSGKQSHAYATSFGELSNATFQYYLSTAFSKVSVYPFSYVGIMGLASDMPFLKESFELIGVTPQFTKRHEYKSAPEMFTETKMSPANKEATQRILDVYLDTIINATSAARKATPERIKELIDRSPLTSKEALAAGLIDARCTWHEFKQDLKTQYGKKIPFYSSHKYVRQLTVDPKAPRIAIINATGDVVLGKTAPVLGRDTSIGSSSFIKNLNAALKNKKNKAIIIRINSPGGSPVASDVIRSAILRIRRKGIPVIVSMSEMAASGGYYISMPASYVLAHPFTLTGSIGVFSGKFVTKDLSDKLNVNWDRLQYGKNAAMWSNTTEFNESELSRLDTLIDQVYEEFTTKAALDRNMPIEKLRPLARGRVWTGQDALKHGLIDGLGGYEEAEAKAKELAKIPAEQDVRIISYPRPRKIRDILSTYLNDFDFLMKANQSLALLAQNTNKILGPALSIFGHKPGVQLNNPELTKTINLSEQ